MERHNEKRTEPDRVLVRGTGPAGRLARAGVGLALIALALFWRDPVWMDAVLGLMVAPAVLLGAMAWRARRAPEPLRATGPVGHAVNLAIAIPLFILPATAGAAFLFYGASMLLAAARRNASCEVTAFSNVVLGRDDRASRGLRGGDPVYRAGAGGRLWYGSLSGVRLPPAA